MVVNDLVSEGSNVLCNVKDLIKEGFHCVVIISGCKRIKEGSSVLTELKRGSTVLSSSLAVKDLVKEGSSVLT